MGERHIDRFMLWVDAVGGFLVCPGDEVVLGQPVRCSAVDIPILGDISSRHARIRRDREGYLIEALRQVRLDGRPIEQWGSLRDGSRISLDESVRLVFRRPHALSASARLDFDSPHRTEPAADAVLLMAQTCVLGPHRHNHVFCGDWPQEVILYRHDARLYCRTEGSFEIDGIWHEYCGPITQNSRIEGDGFSLNLEEIR